MFADSSKYTGSYKKNLRDSGNLITANNETQKWENNERWIYDAEKIKQVKEKLDVI